MNRRLRWLLRRFFRRRFGWLVGRADGWNAGNGFRWGLRRRLGYLGLEHEVAFITRKRSIRASEIHLSYISIWPWDGRINLSENPWFSRSCEKLPPKPPPRPPGLYRTLP